MNSKSSITLLALCLILLSVPSGLTAQISVTKIAEYQIGNEAQPQNANEQLNLRSHQDDAIVSFNGYQYAVYYSTVGANQANRYVTIGRRKLPGGAWETVKLTDHAVTINDSHRVVSMGICEGDGTIHMAFDHHNNDLNYRVSVQGLATNPTAHAWVADKFQAVVHALPGLATSDTTGLTYPRFTHTPNGDLQLIRRKGSAINGRSHLYTYSKNTHLWVKHGVYLDGNVAQYQTTDLNGNPVTTKLNGYLHGANYDANGRLHISWVWRTTDGRNFDLMYAYSDNQGLTWKNNAGQLAGQANSDPMVYQNTPAVKVRTYAEGILYNQTGQTVDSQGRVHVVQRKNGKFMHLYRNTSGQWIENTTNLPQGRYKLTVDQHDNLYYITRGARVYAATPANNYNDWSLVYNADFSRFVGDPMFDEYRMKHEGILSILVAKPGASTEIYSVDLSVSPIVVPAGPILQDTTLQAWDIESTWNPDGLPAAGFDYSTNLRLRTLTTTATFPGDSLTVYTDGQLQLRHTGLSKVTTVPQLILSGGRIYAGTGNDVVSVLDGNITVSTDSELAGHSTDDTYRHLRILSEIGGTANLTNTCVLEDSLHEVQITNAANTFSGTWIGERGKLVFENAGAVGSADIVLLEKGKLEIQGDWNQSENGATLTVADSADVLVEMGAYQWNLAGLKIGNITLPVGNHSVAYLNTLGNAVFSGTGIINIELPILSVSLNTQTSSVVCSWDNTGFKLQMQNDGLFPNLWIDHPDGAASPVTHPIEVEQHPTAFFRLIEK